MKKKLINLFTQPVKEWYLQLLISGFIFYFAISFYGVIRKNESAFPDIVYYSLIGIEIILIIIACVVLLMSVFSLISQIYKIKYMYVYFLLSIIFFLIYLGFNNMFFLLASLIFLFPGCFLFLDKKRKESILYVDFLNNKASCIFFKKNRKKIKKSEKFEINLLKNFSSEDILKYINGFLLSNIRPLVIIKYNSTLSKDSPLKAIEEKILRILITLSADSCFVLLDKSLEINDNNIFSITEKLPDLVFFDNTEKEIKNLFKKI